MKIFRPLLILGVIALMCNTAQGQILNRINRSVQNAAQNAAEKAATKKAEEKVEEAVTKAVEKGFEANEKAEAQVKAKSESEAEPYTGPVREAPKDAAKFPFEHGSYVLLSEALGIEMKTTVYFSHSGEWQAIEDKSEIKFLGMSTKMDKLHIIKGNKHWDLDLAENTGSYYEVESSSDDTDAVLQAALGGSPTEGMEITELGEENYIGYACRKVHVKYPILDMDVTCLSYGTLIMKNEGRVGPVKTSVRILSIDQNAPPASKFEVPSGIKID